MKRGNSRDKEKAARLCVWGLGIHMKTGFNNGFSDKNGVT